MTVKELVDKYCNGKDDEKLFNAIIHITYEFGHEWPYELDENEDEFRNLDEDDLVKLFITKVNLYICDYWKLIEHVDDILHDNYCGRVVIYGSFDLFDIGGFLDVTFLKLFEICLKEAGYVKDGTLYCDSEETKEEYEFIAKYASKFADGLDIYDFLDYLKDNGLDVYNDDDSICYGSKTVYTFDDNITSLEEAKEILKEIKAKL